MLFSKSFEKREEKKEEVRFAIRPIDDRGPDGRFTTPDVSPEGFDVEAKWSAYRDSAGYVWYGKEYKHKKKP